MPLWTQKAPRSPCHPLSSCWTCAPGKLHLQKRVVSSQLSELAGPTYDNIVLNKTSGVHGLPQVTNFEADLQVTLDQIHYWYSLVSLSSRFVLYTSVFLRHGIVASHPLNILQPSSTTRHLPMLALRYDRSLVACDVGSLPIQKTKQSHDVPCLQPTKKTKQKQQI